MLTGFLLVVLAAGLSLFVHRRGFVGYAPAPAGLAVLHRGEAAFVYAVAEVLFPAGGGMALSGAEAGVAHAVDRHLAALPRAQRIQIRLLFHLIEHLTLLLPGHEPGGRQRFSSLSAAARVDLLERLANHRRSLIRLLFTALRSVFVLAYLGHPGNLEGLGLAPFEIDPVVTDAEVLFPRVGALPSSIPWDATDRTEPVCTPLDPEGPRHPAYARAAVARAGRSGRAGS
ncbi:MAG: gluconate 2-dehydrogenase subunit 3 family protein [Myxococcota bacterium]